MESNNKISSNNINLLNKEDLRDKVGIKNSDDKNKNINHNYALINFKLPQFDNKNFEIMDFNLTKLDDNEMKIEGIEIFKNIKHILTSTMRTRLLISLFSSEKDLKSLRNDLGKPSTSILHGIKELDKLNLIKKNKKMYGLSSNGTILTINVINLIQNIYSINKNSHFWKYHCIDDIPKDSLKKIHLIQNAKSIKSSDNDLAKTSREYTDLISNSKNIKVLLPIFSAIHLDAILSSLNDFENLELIVSENILEFIKDNGYGVKLLSFIKDSAKNKDNLNNDYSIKIWKLSKEIKIFLSSCDNFLSLGLFSHDGYYDDSIMILDETEEGISWGIGVFEHYKNYSEPIDILKYFSL